MKARCWWGALWLVVAGTVQADDASRKLVDCMRANIPPSLQIKEIELTSVDRAGSERVLKGKVYASRVDGLIRVLLRVSRPRDLDGAAYLMREGGEGRKDEIFLYLPAIQRVRKISGASTDGALLGTDFSYNDMKQLQAAFGDAKPALEKASTIGDRPVDVLSLTPANAATARYSRVLAYVDRKSCTALKAEFYEGKQLRKELTTPADSLKQADGYWYLSELTMRDLKDGTRTRLKVTGLVGSTDELPSKLFDPTSFYRGY